MKLDVTAIITCMTEGERPFIREALRSVHAQTLPQEVIVVAETSNGWIDAIAADFPGTGVLRIPLARLGAVRNAAVAAAKGEFVAFLDGDDVWQPGKTLRQVAFLRERGADFVAVDHLLMDEGGRVFAYALARHLPMPSAWMVRRETMLRHPFREDVLHGVEDGLWWTDTWGHFPKFRLAEPLLNYRVRGRSLSTVAPSKRRKLALARLSALPLVRPLLLAGTYALHRAGRRADYVPVKAWQVSGTSAALHGRI